MLTIINNIDLNINTNFDKYFNSKNICFLDIETTGLSSKYHYIYLIGIMYYDTFDKSWKLIQLFSESPDEEKELLLSLLNYINRFDYIINYNGDTFDIPFINARLNYYNIDYKIQTEKSIDIFKYVRANKNFLKLENLKLKTLEKSIGIHREDKYSGKDCIEFYKKYLKNKDEELKDIVLKHNYDDLYYLVFIIKFFDIIEERKTINLRLDNNPITLKVEDIIKSGDLLVFRGSFIGDIYIQYYGINYNLILENDSTFEISFECSLGLVSQEKKALYIDKYNYPILNNVIDSTNFSLAPNILLLQVENNYCIENIKSIIISLIENSMG